MYFNKTINLLLLTSISGTTDLSHVYDKTLWILWVALLRTRLPHLVLNCRKTKLDPFSRSLVLTSRWPWIKIKKWIPIIFCKNSRRCLSDLCRGKVRAIYMWTVNDHGKFSFQTLFHHQISHVIYRWENQTSVWRDHQIVNAVSCL